MNTYQINDYLRNIKNFAGTFPCNFIPMPTKFPAYYVVNLSRFNPDGGIGQGTHWVAIGIDAKKRGTYFDSMGIPPLQPDILNFLSKTCKRFKHNTQTLQSSGSYVCGVYCIDFICSQSQGMGLREYLKHFSMDLAGNDRCVTRRVNSHVEYLRPRNTIKLEALLK